jgi:DNA-binding FadR family transcriptional regulator
MVQSPFQSEPARSMRSRRRDEAHRQILALITDGHLEGGDRLPSEDEMATRFGMSRPTIREALSELQQAGVVRVRHGAGSFVLSTEAIAQNTGPEPSFGPVKSLTDVRHCFELRASLEGEAAAFAAERQPSQPLQAATAALANLERAISNESVGVEANFQFDADFEFHRAIAQASENPYFERVLLSMRESIDFTIGLSRSLSLTFSSQRLKVVQNEHVRVLDMIRAGDSKKAREAMRTHLMNACNRVFDGPNGQPAILGR